MKQHHTPQAGPHGISPNSGTQEHYPRKFLGTIRKRQITSPGPVAADISAAPGIATSNPGPIAAIEIHVICIYPSVQAGKLARQWIETALRTTFSTGRTFIEYFNYAVLSHEGISWTHVIQRMQPDILLLVGDGSSQLDGGLRNSLKELIARSNNGSKPLVIFRDLEPEPGINTRTLLDYVAALTQRNHCELKAMNGNGTPIGCFRHPHHLLKARKHHE